MSRKDVWFVAAMEAKQEALVAQAALRVAEARAEQLQQAIVTFICTEPITGDTLMALNDALRVPESGLGATHG